MNPPDFPRITLVTPVYNGEELLTRNVESVAASKYPNLEHILVDNRSTDGSWALMNSLAQRHAHVRVTRQDATQGAAASINHGFAPATGDVFAWLGHDDLWFPETPWRVREHWRTRPDARFLAGAVRILLPDGSLDLDRKPLAGLDFWDLFISSHIVNQEGCFWSRDIHQPLDPGIRGAFDYDLWLRLFSGEHFRADHTDELLACFQKRAGQLSGDTGTYTDEMNLCRARHCGRLLGRPPEEFLRFQEQLAALLHLPAFRGPCEQRIARDGALFAPRLNRELCLAGIFFLLARPGDEIVFEVHDSTARSIGLLENSRTRAVAKMRTKQARLTILVPDSGLVGVDLTSRGVDDPNASWIKCGRIRCGDRIVARAPRMPVVPASAPEVRLEYPRA